MYSCTSSATEVLAADTGGDRGDRGVTGRGATFACGISTAGLLDWPLDDTATGLMRGMGTLAVGMGMLVMGKGTLVMGTLVTGLPVRI